MRTFMRALWRNEQGATAIEYGLIISLIVIAMVGAFTSLASKTNTMWNNVSSIVSAH